MVLVKFFAKWCLVSCLVFKARVLDLDYLLDLDSLLLMRVSRLRVDACPLDSAVPSVRLAF